eukprot:SM000018S03622  [mRNA]  locus=s18:326173:327359:- [translate_table: standard]
MERAEEERKKRVVVTFDLLGRKVVMAESEQLGDVAEEAALLSTSTSSGATQDLNMRVKPSPSLCIPPPIFVDLRALGKSHTRTTKAEGAVKSSGAASGVGRGPSERSWMRVQHDDPLAEAVGVISQEASLSKAAGCSVFVLGLLTCLASQYVAGANDLVSLTIFDRRLIWWDITLAKARLAKYT